MKKTLKESKKFAIKGKVLDMAVGVILGGAFGRIVTSFVNDILMPFISLLTGRVSLADLTIIIYGFDPQAPPVSENYGQFLQNILDFFIIALSIFVMVKIIKRIREKYMCRYTEQADEPVKPSKEETLLLEIRDMLQEKSVKQND